jgi:hypothetical protein
MKDNVLKKEFSKNDVQRVRNLVQGKYGEKTVQSVGYSKKQEFHKEGDVWEVDGKRWTIKNGIKQTITKLDKIKNLVVMPLACPTCKGVMKLTDIEKKMWAIHKTCFNCVLEKEAEIKRQGKWVEYEGGIMNTNKNAALVDLEGALESWFVQDDSFVTEQGDIESWNGGNKKDIYKQVKERIAELKQVDIYNKEKSE